jgi:hypothetical protein
MQAVEIRNAVDAEQHAFTIDHERAVPVSKRSLGDQRIAIAPVVAVAGEQVRVFTVALNDQASDRPGRSALCHFRTHASRFDCSRGRPHRERDDVVGGIEERLRDVITLADQHHLGRCRIGVG